MPLLFATVTENVKIEIWPFQSDVLILLPMEIWPFQSDVLILLPIGIWHFQSDVLILLQIEIWPFQSDVFFFLKLPKEIWPFQSESWFYFHCLWKLSNCSVSYVKGNYFFILKLQLFGTLFQIVNGANNLVCIVSVRNRVAMLDRICLTWWLLVLECEKAN